MEDIRQQIENTNKNGFVVDVSMLVQGNYNAIPRQTVMTVFAAWLDV